MRRIGLLLAVLGVAACAHKPEAATSVATAYKPPGDTQVPDFAKRPYAPFSRAAVVAIALREWRMFGQPIDDDPPESRPPPPPELKPEREEGYWQRIGEYWWTALDPSEKESAYTGKHDGFGMEFAAGQDGEFAWSAAFISYVMRIAGAGNRFPYSQNHATYINIAKQTADGSTNGWVVSAERPEAYAPEPGDLICLGRGRSARLKFDNLPTVTSFPAHCDIVVQRQQGQIAVVGGNVDDAVTMKHVPVTPDGKLAGPDGVILDTRYPWMVVLRITTPTPVS